VGCDAPPPTPPVETAASSPEVPEVPEVPDVPDDAPVPLLELAESVEHAPSSVKAATPRKSASQGLTDRGKRIMRAVNAWAARIDQAAQREVSAAEQMGRERLENRHENATCIRARALLI
jgi:hypothetical protein